MGRVRLNCAMTEVLSEAVTTRATRATARLLGGFALLTLGIGVGCGDASGEDEESTSAATIDPPTPSTTESPNLPDSEDGPGVPSSPTPTTPLGPGEPSSPDNTATPNEPSMPTPGPDDGFTIDASLSPDIATVGIIEWSLDAQITSAYIDYGRDAANFEYRASVDLDEPNRRTLLLGMKPDTTYYFQITAETRGGPVSSAVASIETGFLPNGLPQINVMDVDPAALYGGFTINCTGVGSGGFMNMGGGETWMFIFDKDGDHVWAYDLTDTPAAGCSRARMSFDGKHMWAGNFSNVSPDGALLRISMDGSGEPDTYSLPGRHHDFAILPNNHVLFYEQENGGGYTNGSEGPDIIRELDPETGESSDIYHENEHFSVQIEESGAHTNHINYVPELNAISFSLRHTSTIGLISYPEAELLAVFGGPLSSFDISWDIQHGHQVLEDSILIFNNEGSNGGSSILEYEFDIESGTASQIMNYSSGNSSGAFGDVKRLPNGNTFITYSTSGVIHEIGLEHELLREITTESIGYSEHRKSLYGPPPPFEQ